MWYSNRSSKLTRPRKEAVGAHILCVHESYHIHKKACLFSAGLEADEDDDSVFSVPDAAFGFGERSLV